MVIYSACAASKSNSACATIALRRRNERLMPNVFGSRGVNGVLGDVRGVIAHALEMAPKQQFYRRAPLLIRPSATPIPQARCDYGLTNVARVTSAIN